MNKFLCKLAGLWQVTGALTLLTLSMPAMAGEWVNAPTYFARPAQSNAEQPVSTHVGVPQPVDMPSTMPSRSVAEPGSSPVAKPIIENPTKPSAPVITESQTNVTRKTDRRLKPFLDVVRTNFPAWDLNHDSTLDRTELETAAQDPHYTGDAAAALAVLKIDADARIKAKKDLGLSRFSDIDAIQTKSANGEKLDSDFGRMYGNALNKLKNEPRQLYIDSLPHLSTIHQASTLDCYFLSSVGGLLETNPRAIVDMIQPNPDGTYNVTFPGKPAMVIPAPTETELAAYTVANDGFWLTILEKAYGKIRHLAPENYTAEPLDAAALYAGNCSEVIRLLTGHHTRTINFHPAPKVDPTAVTASSTPGTTPSSGTASAIQPGTAPVTAAVAAATTGAAATAPQVFPQADDAILVLTRAALKDTFAQHKIATASKVHHAYTVTAYDIGNDTVTVHNPYGSNGFEHWQDGSKGPQMTNGFYTCSVPEFCRFYRCISVEK